MVEKLILCAAIIFVMPLVFNICNGYPAGTGHLSWYLTNTKSSSSTVPKISRVILGLLLGSHHLRPTCVYIKNRVMQETKMGVVHSLTYIKEFHRSFTKHPVSMVLPHIGGQALSVEVSTDLLTYWCEHVQWHFEKARQGIVKSESFFFLLNFSLIITWSLSDVAWSQYDSTTRRTRGLKRGICIVSITAELVLQRKFLL